MRSLRAQVTLSVALLTAIVVGGAGLLIAVRIDHQDRGQVDRELRARAVKVEADAGKTEERAFRGDANLLAGTGTLTRVLVGGEVVDQRGEGLPPDQAVPAPPGLATVEIDGQAWRSLVEPTRTVANGRLQVLQNLAPVEQRLGDNRRLIAVVAVAATLLVGLAAWLIVGLVLRPLERLRHAAATIRPGDERLPEVGGQQEITELSATLDAMLARLQVSMQATQRFTADAGHELRTPLTGLGMDLETLRRNPGLPRERRAEILDAMSHEHARIVGLLDGLQRLARGDAEALPDRAVIDIGHMAEAATRAAAERHPAVTYRAAVAPALVDGWPDGIRLAIDNLLDNAAVHGRPAGTVEVGVKAADGIARVRVDDDGPGIAAEDRSRVTERFARGPRPRGPGSGLGLALVEQQARLHGGSLTLADGPAGGLRATLALPLASAVNRV
jgi:two-component system sensor histidine kinase PrrB